MTAIARTRADVDLRSSPKAGAGVIDRLPSDCQVEILEDLNRWLKVKPERVLHGISGYLSQAALIFPAEDSIPVFPSFPLAPGQTLLSSVPPSLKVTDFSKWLTEGGKPGWFPERSWLALGNERHTNDFLGSIRAASTQIQPRWDDWQADLMANLRLEDALMNEWIVIMEGGRDVYAIRDHYIYINPVQNSDYFGWALRGQIMRWTGNVLRSKKDGQIRDYYEVDFYRLSRYMHGWFRADVAAEYVFPLPNDDPAIEGNADKVFDLSKPILRLPQDPAIAESQKKRYAGAQYIDVYEATNRHLVHFSLCGEFCVAALNGKDVLPLLKTWLDSKFWRAAAILKDPQEGTSAADLQSLLAVAGFKSEMYSSIPTSPQLIKNRLASGQFAIVGCGINSLGKIKSDGKIRHWVVLEDILPSDIGGWVRVYNPFQNREEVYNYSLFLSSVGAGAGLWVFPKAI